MTIGIYILVIALAVLFLVHTGFYAMWLRGSINLRNFFKHKIFSLLFFVPILGLLAFIVGATSARLDEDFN